MTATIRQLLHIEDNPADREMFRIALARVQVPCVLNVARDGEEALAYLNAEAPFVGRVQPDLILLDLNLPRLSGRELLVELKSELRWKRIPVLVLSSSEAASDVARAYELSANCYLPKPPDYLRLEALVRRIKDFWLDTACIPPNS